MARRHPLVYYFRQSSNVTHQVLENTLLVSRLTIFMFDISLLSFLITRYIKNKYIFTNKSKGKGMKSMAANFISQEYVHSHAFLSLRLILCSKSFNKLITTVTVSVTTLLCRYVLAQRPLSARFWVPNILVITFLRQKFWL